MLNNIFDTHAHYTDKRFADDQAQVLRSLPGRGVARVLTCGSGFADSRAALALAREYPHVYAACGVHPHEASGFGDAAHLRELLLHEKCVAVGEIGLDYHYDFSPREIQRGCFARQLELAQKFGLPVIVHDREAHEDTLKLLQEYKPRGVVHCFSGSPEFAREILALAHEYAHVYAACGVHPHAASGFDGPDELRVLLRDEKCVAVGEIGLDYHYDFSPRQVQRVCFARQLELAREFGLPVIVHDREAHEDTLRLLQEYKPRGVVHCFSGSPEFAREILALGMYIGLGGAVTFRNAKKPLEVAACVPLDRLLLETDAPYMAPEPHRGQRCDSAHIAYTAQKIAAVRGMDAQELIDACHENGKRLFALEEYLK